MKKVLLFGIATMLLSVSAAMASAQYNCDGNYSNGDYWQVYYNNDTGSHMLCSGSPWTCSSISLQQAANRCQAGIR